MKVLSTLLAVAASACIPVLAQDTSAPQPSPASTPAQPPQLPATPPAAGLLPGQSAASPALNFQQYAPYMAIIIGDQSAGSGFIASYEGGHYLFTNTHVIRGNTRVTAKLLNGKPIALNGVAVADNYDISAFPQTTVTSGGIEILKDIDQNVAIGDDVVVLGNSLGAAVVTEIAGKVTGIGPELIEVDAKFVAGNSGSPIIHVKTGKAIAIATFTMMRKMENFGRDSQFNSVERRFGYRLDNIGGWRNMTWQAFTKEAAAVAALEKRTEDLWNLAADIARHQRISDWDVHMQRGNSLAPVITEYQKAISVQDLSPSAFTDAKRKLLFWINREVQKDMASPAYASFAPYNKKLIEEQKDYRDKLSQFFNQVEANLK